MLLHLTPLGGGGGELVETSVEAVCRCLVNSVEIIAKAEFELVFHQYGCFFGGRVFRSRTGCTVGSKGRLTGFYLLHVCSFLPPSCRAGDFEAFFFCWRLGCCWRRYRALLLRVVGDETCVTWLSFRDFSPFRFELLYCTYDIIIFEYILFYTIGPGMS